MSINKYLDSLSLSQDIPNITDKRLTRGPQLGAKSLDEKTKSAVVSGSLISFVDGINPQDNSLRESQIKTMIALPK